MPNITVQYFAILREQRGLAREQLSTSAATPRALYEELRSRHNFTLPFDRIRAAIDGEFVGSDVPLKGGAEVTYIPPVAGG